MADEKTGHELARDQQDAFELSDEDFADALATAGEDSDDDTTEEFEQSDTDEGDADEEAPEFEAQEPTSEEPTERPSEAPEAGSKKLRIVHNGREIELEEHRVRELAQKGYDYDYKIGKHSRLAKLADADPRIAMMIDDLVQGRIEYDPRSGLKAAGEEPDIRDELKPIEEYEDPNDWLIENAEKILNKKRQPTEEKNDRLTPEQRVLGDRDALAEMMIKRSDAATFERVAPLIGDQMKKLPYEQMEKVSNSLDELLRFYDHLAAQTSPSGPPPPPTRKIGDPQFTVATRSAPPAAGAQAAESVWSMSKKDFEAKLSAAKGY